MNLRPSPTSLILPLIAVAWPIVIAAAEPAVADASPQFTAIDLRGDCRGGMPKYPGKTVQVDGRVEMSAHGSEFGHHCGEDQGHFAYVAVEGDFDVAVQVAALTNRGAQRYDGYTTAAKGGLMVREGNDPGARYVAIWAASNDANDNELHKYADAFHFDARLDPEAWLGSQPEGRFLYGAFNRRDGELFLRDYPNVWVRLKREGDKFYAFISKDGKIWHSSFRDQHGKPWQSGTPHFAVNLPRVVHLGVALASAAEGDRNARSTAVFQNLSGFPEASPGN